MSRPNSQLARCAPHVPIAKLGVTKCKAEHGAWVPRERSIFANAGTSRDRLGVGETELGIKDLDTE